MRLKKSLAEDSEREWIEEDISDKTEMDHFYFSGRTEQNVRQVYSNL